VREKIFFYFLKNLFTRQKRKQFYQGWIQGVSKSFANFAWGFSFGFQKNFLDKNPFYISQEVKSKIHKHPPQFRNLLYFLLQVIYLLQINFSFLFILVTFQEV